MTLRIQCWSGPRNVSTALMYSFRQRADTTVVDEPLYAHFLTVSGRDDPGRDEVLAAHETDAAVVIRDVILGPHDTPVVFFKQIGSHLAGLDRAFLAETENILLTRDPDDMLASLARVVPDATLADTGLPGQVELLDDLVARGAAPVVIDSADLLADPEGLLTRVCERLGLAFDPAMLSWPPGPKPEDGVWGRHWYANVHRSTGFAAPAGAGNRRVPDHLLPVLDAARPLHERLRAHALSP